MRKEVRDVSEDDVRSSDLDGTARTPAEARSILDGLFRSVRPIVSFAARRPLVVIVLCGTLAAVGAYLTLQLRVNNDFASLIPPEYPSVQALERLRDEYGGEHEVAVLIESPSFEANKAFAESLIPRALALRGGGRIEPYFTHVEFRREVEFLEKNALYFATTAELDTVERFLREGIRRAKLEANPFYFEIDEEGADDTLAGTLLQAYEDLVGSEYPVSDDSTAMAVRFYPSGAQTDNDFIEDAYADLGLLVDSLGPRSYHSGMEVTLAGRLLRQLIEVRAVMRDVRSSFGSGILLLLLIVAAYFSYKSFRAAQASRVTATSLMLELARAPLLTLLIAVPLFIGEAVTFGIAYLVYGSINMMTSALGLVLFGLGIDFGIHFFARYAEEREAGKSLEDALFGTMTTTGQAIAAVAVTTAAGFYILMLADFRGFSQFGFIAGTGILVSLLSTLILMPCLLALFDRLRATSVRPRKRAAVGRYSMRFRAPRMFVAAGAAVTLGAVLLLPRVSFEYHFGSLTPDYPEYDSLQSKVRRIYSDRTTRNAAYVLVDDPVDVPSVVSAIRTHMASDTLTRTVREVESLQDRYPMSSAAQEARLARLEAIRALLDDPFIREERSEELDILRSAAGTRRPISLEEVPTFLRERFTSKNGVVGQVVIIYPAVSLSDGRRSMEFADDVGTIRTVDGSVYHAASTSIVASDMLRLMISETPYMIALTIVFVVLFKWIILRRVLWIAMAFATLAASFVWMFGWMGLFGWKLNFYNMVVLPTVLGIGDDSSIHITHRYLEEGRGSIPKVVRSTGEHIAVSALTTIVGFGGLLTSSYPGMRSIGELAVVGISMTLLAALIFLPAMIQWQEERTGPVEPALW